MKYLRCVCVFTRVGPNGQTSVCQLFIVLCDSNHAPKTSLEHYCKKFHTSSASSVRKQDYYDVLGVSRSSTQQDIKKAYYQLAKKYHPDMNQTDSGSSKKFQEISEAYEVLGDEARRNEYNTFGSSGNTGHNTGFHSTMSAEELFNKIFGRDGFKMSGFSDFQDFAQSDQGFAGASEVNMKLTFEESARGCSKPINVSVMENCPRCHGNQAEPGTKRARCHHCNGTGVEAISTGAFTMRTRCRYCGGSRVLIKTPCVQCRGKGQTLQRRNVTVDIPAGVEDGQTLRMAIGNREIFIALKVDKNKHFRRVGADIHSDVNISLAQAIFGGTIRVRGIQEEILHTIPVGTSSHVRIRLVGKGIARPHSHGRGDHYLHIRINVPSELTSRQRALLLAFAETESSATANGTVKGLIATQDGNQVYSENDRDAEILERIRKVFDEEESIASLKRRDSL